MPNYVYTCSRCGRTQERIVSLADLDKEQNCGKLVTDEIECEGVLIRTISGPGFKLVGKGFHCNDYPKRGK